MSTVPTIAAGSINNMTGLTERPVFFLTVNGSRTPNLVVKGERKGESTIKDLETSIAWSAKLMKNVNNSLVNTKIMTPSEVDAFCRAAPRFFAANSAQTKRVTIDRNSMIWVKMPFVRELSDADLYTDDKKVHRVDGKATNLYEVKKIKSALASLLNEKVWTDLGKIVAVDIFNGNSDRFNPDNGNWANKGNVMFLDKGVNGAIGLDTWDSQNRTLVDNNAFSNLNKTGHYDSLKTLINPGYRHSFASKCLISMGEEFQTAMNKSQMSAAVFNMIGGASVTIQINASEVKNFFVQTFLMDFSLGLQQGADELKRYLQGKARQYQATTNPSRGVGLHHAPARPSGNAPIRPTTNAPMKHLPAGVLSRMQYLGW